ncbi:MAG: biotin-dependent carboxyltransferase family protein [Saprospiraceae bacterium]
MIKVVRAGLKCSIQDKGRYGYRHLGMPVSGWMDDKSALAANLLLGNNENDAILEIGPIGPDLVFLKNTSILLTGALKKCFFNEKPMPFYKIIEVKKGDVISIKSGANGVWSYLGVKGGFQISKILGSRSSYFPIDIGVEIIKGNEIHTQNMDYFREGSNSRIRPELNTKREIIVRHGPEFDFLQPSQKEYLFAKEFRIEGKSDRMAYYLTPNNKNFLSGVKDIITSAVVPGTIQLLPSGGIMALMRDCQTTGGYARILQVVQNDMSVLAQKRPGEIVKFCTTN